MARLSVEIVTPSDKVFTGETYMVSVPGINGSMGFLPGHVGLVTPLGKGKVNLCDDESMSKVSKTFEIEGGYAQVFDNKVLILAEHVE